MSGVSEHEVDVRVRERICVVVLFLGVGLRHCGICIFSGVFLFFPFFYYLFFEHFSALFSTLQLERIGSDQIRLDQCCYGSCHPFSYTLSLFIC